MKVRACLRSGFCCMKAPCPFGEWDEEQQRCAFLVLERADPVEQFACGRYEEILARPPSAGAEVSPAFGGGCCMSLFNERRDSIRSQVHGGVEQFVILDEGDRDEGS